MRRKDDIETSRGRSDRRGVGVRWWHDAAAKRLRWVGPDGTSHTLLDDRDGGGGGGGGGAPTSADYLVKTADAGLSAERVVTDTTSITVDWSTAGQAKFQRAALTGDVTASANSNATTIANDAVTYAKMQNVSADTRILGRAVGAGAGDVTELTPAQVSAIAAVGDATNAGVLKLGASGGAEEYGKIAGVTISGTPSAGQVPVASSSSAAAWSSIPFMYVIPGSLYQVPACMWNGGTLGTGSAIAANVYKAMPFIAPFSGTIDLIAIQVITAIAASNAVIAIWSDSGGVPGSVLGQATVSTATTGSKSGTVSITVEFGRLYWSTYLGSTAGVVLRGPPTASLMAPGYALTSGDTAARVKLEVAQAYASPTPAWPGGASWVTSASSVAYVFYQRAT